MCSDSTGTGGQSSDWRSTMSCHQMSRSGVMWTSCPRRLTTIAASIVGVEARASSAWCLSADLLAAPVAAVGGDQDLRAAVVDAARQGLRREATEDDRVRRPDPRTGQHRDRQLGDHRHVDGDPVAGLDAEFLERVGGLADLALEIAEGEGPGVARLADPVIGDLVAEPSLDVTVDAVVGDVQLAAGEPLGERQVPLEGLVERLRPVDAFARALRPELFEVGLGLGVQVGRRIRLCGELGVRREDPRFHHEILDLRRRKGRLDAHGNPRFSTIDWPSHRTPSVRRGVPRRVVPKGGLPYSVPSARSSWSGAAPPAGPARGVGDRDVAQRSGDLDATGLERVEQAPAEVPGGSPLVGRANGPEDLEGHSGLAQLADPLDARRLEDPSLPDRIVGHLAPDRVDDPDGRVDVGAVGDRDVLVDARPDAGQVGGHVDLAVGDRVHHAIEVAQRRPPQREVLDGPLDARDAHDVAPGELVLDQDERAVEVVADEELRPEADRDPDHAETRDGRPDVESELTEDHQPGDDHDEELDDVRRQAVERVHPLLELDGAQLLGRAFGRLPVEERLDDAVDEQLREAQCDERRDDDDQGRQEVSDDEIRDGAPRFRLEVRHRRTA